MDSRVSKSNLIKSSTVLHRRARRRLIGSVFLLIVALLILLNVTTRIKPVAITPQSIEIKNASNPISVVDSSSSTNNASSVIALKPVQSSAVISQGRIAVIAASSPVITPVLPSAVVAESSPLIIESKVAATVAPLLKGIIVALKVQQKSSPADILNGIAPQNKDTTQYFVEFTVSSDKAHLDEIKRDLRSQGMPSTIIKAQSPSSSTTLYQLRAGPFTTRDQARAANAVALLH